MPSYPNWDPHLSGDDLSLDPDALTWGSSILTPSWKITLGHHLQSCGERESRNHRELLQLTSWQNFLAWLRAGTSRTLGQSDPLCENFEFQAMPCKGRKEKEHSKDGTYKECPSELPSETL